MGDFKLAQEEQLSTFFQISFFLNRLFVYMENALNGEKRNKNVEHISVKNHIKQILILFSCPR
jgi:hypothetical protein